MTTLTFHHALLQAEAMARATLDVALHERLSAGVALVKDGRVFQATDGTWQVDSATQPGVTYTVNGQCPCADSHYQKPPQGLCKHRLAMFLAQRVQTLMAEPPTPVVLPEEMDVYPDNEWPEEEPVAPAPPAVPAQAPQGCPEALFSLTLRGTYQGHAGTLLTVRGMTAAEFHANLAAVRGLLDQPPAAPAQPPPPLSPQQQNALAMHRPLTGYCAVHEVAMTLNTGKEGRQWYSHRLPEGGFCKGR